jgi:hypothetical protein
LFQSFIILFVASLPPIAYPSLSETARLLNVPKSTLAQREFPVRPAGNRKHIPAAAVVDLALYFRRREVEDVVRDLVDFAGRAAGADAARSVEAEAASAIGASRGQERSHAADEAVLERMRREYDRLVSRMRSPANAAGLRRAFAELTPEEMGRAAVAAAQPRARVRAARAAG